MKNLNYTGVKLSQTQIKMILKEMKELAENFSTDATYTLKLEKKSFGIKGFLTIEDKSLFFQSDSYSYSPLLSFNQLLSNIKQQHRDYARSRFSERLFGQFLPNRKYA